jgi:putative ABC transport system permease protein
MSISGSRWLAGLQDDARYGLRLFLRSPQVLLVSMLSLGLAVGVNTTIFSLFRAIEGKPVTATEPERLERMKFGPGAVQIQVSYLDYKEIRGGKAFADLAGFASLSANWRLGDDTRRLETLGVTANFFDLLGARPALGRLFRAAEAEQEPRLAVISHKLWQQSGADPHIIGHQAIINGASFTVIGVLPRNFRSVMMLALAPDLYVPLSTSIDPKLDDHRRQAIALLGRLAPGETAQAAQAALVPITQYLKHTYPGEDTNFSAPEVFPTTGIEEMQQEGMGIFLGFFGLLILLVGAVVLIACINISTLLAARAIARRREMAMRLALGAERGRLIRQLLTESLMLSLICTSFGLLLHAGLSGLINRVHLPLPFEVTLDMSADWQLFAYSLSLVLGATIFCGIVPVQQATRFDLNSTLKQVGAAQAGKFRLSRLLVSVEFGATATLLMVAFMFIQSLLHVSATSPGFDVAHTALIRIQPQSATNQPTTPSLAQRLDQITSLPGIKAASVASEEPLSMSYDNGVFLRVADQKNAAKLQGEPMSVGPNYFSTMRIPLLTGREFVESDKLGAPEVALINQTLAHRMFPGLNPVGRRVAIQENQKERAVQVVGVVQDSKYSTLGEESHPILFLPYLQMEQPGEAPILLVRTASDPEGFRAEILKTLKRSDPDSFVQFTPMTQNLSTVLLPSQVETFLLLVLGILALVLALAGVYGIVDYSVSRRTSEIGIRMAVGASRPRILGLILRDTLRTISPGMLLGLLVALGLTKLIGAFLASGAQTANPLDWLGMTVFLVAIGVAAALSPALRAARVDALAALHYE